MYSVWLLNVDLRLVPGKWPIVEFNAAISKLAFTKFELIDFDYPMQVFVHNFPRISCRWICFHFNQFEDYIQELELKSEESVIANQFDSEQSTADPHKIA